MAFQVVKAVTLLCVAIVHARSEAVISISKAYANNTVDATVMTATCRDSDCAAGRACNSDAQCAPKVLLKAGGECDDYEVGCQDGLVCDFERYLCVPPNAPAPLDEFCDAMTPCEEGLVCRSKLNVVSQCIEPVPKALGIRCDDDEQDCAPGLVCDFECKVPGGAGDFCDFEAPCEKGLECGLESTCQKIEPVGLNGKCDDDDFSRPCAGDLECVDEACVAPVTTKEGGDCGFTSCANGSVCTDNTICEKVVRGDLGEACEIGFSTNKLCKQGFSCSGVTYTCLEITTVGRGQECDGDNIRCDQSEKLVCDPSQVLFSNDDDEVQTCIDVAVKGLWETCDDDTQLCEGDLRCLSNKCLTGMSVGLGERCDGNFAQCKDEGVGCGKDGTCTKIVSVGEGEKCDLTVRLCEGDLECGEVDEVCQAPVNVGLGGMCIPSSVLTNCEEGTDCLEDDSVCTTVVKLEVGDDCDEFLSAYLCPEGLVCIRRDSDAEYARFGKCEEVVESTEGGKCNFKDFMCADGFRCDLDTETCTAIPTAEDGQVCGYNVDNTVYTECVDVTSACACVDSDCGERRCVVKEEIEEGEKCNLSELECGGELRCVNGVSGRTCVSVQILKKDESCRQFDELKKCDEGFACLGEFPNYTCVEETSDTSGPGVTCQGDSDCDDNSVCLSSATCEPL